MASSQSCSGAMITSSLNASAEERTSPSTVGAAIAQEDRDLARRLAATQLVARRTQGASQIGRAVSAQREHVSDDQLARLVGALTLHRHDVLAEREHAVARRGSQRDRCRGDRRSRQWLATHRSAAVDRQAQGSIWSAPRPDPKTLEVDGDACRCGLGDHVEAGIEIQVSTIGSIRLLDDLADATPCRWTSPSEIEEQAGGQTPGEIAQLLVGRGHKVGEQCQHLVRIVEQSVRHRGFVEFDRPRAKSVEIEGCARARVVKSCVGATP